MNFNSRGFKLAAVLGACLWAIPGATASIIVERMPTNLDQMLFSGLDLGTGGVAAVAWYNGSAAVASIYTYLDSSGTASPGTVDFWLLSGDSWMNSDTSLSALSSLSNASNPHYTSVSLTSGRVQVFRNLSLSAGTDYFLVGHGNGDGGLWLDAWDYSTYLPAPVTENGSSHFGTQADSLTTDYALNGNTWGAGTTMLSLEVNAVPEPATYFFMGAGLIALAFVRRRK